MWVNTENKIKMLNKCLYTQFLHRQSCLLCDICRVHDFEHFTTELFRVFSARTNIVRAARTSKHKSICGADSIKLQQWKLMEINHERGGNL